MSPGPGPRVLATLALWIGAAAACRGPTAPPAVDLSRADPEVATELVARRGRAQAEPGNGRLRGELGLAFDANGFTSAAAVCYGQAAQLDPDEPRWNYLRSLALAAAGDAEGAVAAMRQVTDRKPDYAPAWLHAGEWLLDSGRVPEALNSFDVAARLDPLHPAARIGRARSLLALGRAGEAVELLQRLAGEGNGHAGYLLAQAYYEAGQVEKAQSTLARYRPTAAPAFADPWAAEVEAFRFGYAADMLRGEAYLEQGRAREAVELFEALRQRRPDDPALLNNLSIAYRSAGQPDRSLEVLEQGVSAHPGSFALQINLSAAAERRGQLERALHHADLAVRIDPELAEGHARRGSILARSGRTAEALAAYETAISAHASRPAYRLAAGALAADLGRWDQARAHLEAATLLAPDHFEARATLSLVYAQLGDFSAAEAALDRAAALRPGDRRIASYRARIASIRRAHS